MTQINKILNLKKQISNKINRQLFVILNFGHWVLFVISTVISDLIFDIPSLEVQCSTFIF